MFLNVECNAGYYGTVSSSCTLCPDNTIKAEQGDAAKCDVECVKSTEPNDEHTECGNNLTLRIESHQVNLLILWHLSSLIETMSICFAHSNVTEATCTIFGKENNHKDWQQ